MPKAGAVRVRLTVAHAATSAEWLLGPYLERGWGARAPDPCDQERAKKLGLQLLKVANRKRANFEFTAYVDRDLARWFGEMDITVGLRGVVLFQVHAPYRVLRAMRRFKTAAAVRPGRAKLSVAAVEDREAGVVRHLDPRQRKRMARRARFERAVAEWHARGRTIAGSAGTDDPYPKM